MFILGNAAQRESTQAPVCDILLNLIIKPHQGHSSAQSASAIQSQENITAMTKALSGTINWRSFLWRLFLITIGALIGALGLVIFLEPAEVAPAGISGVALIMSIKLGTPIGLV